MLLTNSMTASMFCGHSYWLLAVERRAPGLERVNLQTRKVGCRVHPPHTPPQVILFRDRYQARREHSQHLKEAFTNQGQGGYTSDQRKLLTAKALINILGYILKQSKGPYRVHEIQYGCCVAMHGFVNHFNDQH